MPQMMSTYLVSLAALAKIEASGENGSAKSWVAI
jgi:hypothetical protein